MNSKTLSPRRWILLPIDVKVRELYAKVLLSCVAAEKGWGAIIGPKGVITNKSELLPCGVHIEKGIQKGKINEIKRVKATGSSASAWCEEGLIYWGKDDYFQRRLDIQSFDAIEYFFAWGEHQARDMCDVLHRPHEKIILSGNPRFDLLRPEFRGIFSQKAKDIQSKYGKIILVNTKFAFINNVEIKDYNQWLITHGKTKTPEQELLIKKAIDFQKRMFDRFLQIIPVLSKTFPDYVIIIRPHPAENHAPWQRFEQDLPNVKVVFEGNSNEWILASDAMIHNNCTTGVEAFMLDKPAISFNPFSDVDIDHPLPNMVSFTASDEESLIKLVRDVLQKKSYLNFEHDKQIQFASEYIANINGKLACDHIMDTLDKTNMPTVCAVFPIQSAYKTAFLEIASKIKFCITSKILNPPSKQQKTIQIFSGLDYHEVQKILVQLQQATGRFTRVKIVQVDEDTYCFYC